MRKIETRKGNNGSIYYAEPFTKEQRRKQHERIVYLSEVQGCEVWQIAERHGIPESTVHSILNKHGARKISKKNRPRKKI